MDLINSLKSSISSQQNNNGLNLSFSGYVLIACIALPFRQTGVLQVASPTTCGTDTTQAKCDRQSKGFMARAIVNFQDLSTKYWVGSSKCVIKFTLKSKNFIFDNISMILVSTDIILFPWSCKLFNDSYMVSFSHHSPVTALILLKLTVRVWRCDASSLIEGIDVKQFLSAPKNFKAKNPRK